MNIILIGNKSLHKLKLPLTVEGSFFLTDPVTDDVLLNFEANSNEWVLRANEHVKVEDSNNLSIYETRIKSDDVFVLTNKDERKVVYCVDNYDDSFSIYTFNSNVTLNIGKKADNDIIYNNQFIQDRHMSLNYKEGSWYLKTYPKCLVYVNEKLVQQENIILSNGDFVYVYGLKFYVMKNLIIINNPKNLVNLKNNNLKNYQLSFGDININNTEAPVVEYEEIDEEDLYKERDYFFKTPRLRRFIETYELVVANPPQKGQTQEMPMLLTLGPMLTMALMSVITASNTIIRIVNGETTFAQSWTMLLTPAIMLMSSLLWPSLTRWWQKKLRKKQEKVRKKKYRAYIEEKRKLIEAETVNQTAILKENLIDIKTCYNIIVNRERILWERKISQKDFLTVRVGIGDRPIDMNVRYSEEEFTIEKDELKEEVSAMIEKAKMLRDVPISYSFADKQVTAIMGNEAKGRVFLDNIILQLITFHSYDELKIVILTDDEHKSQWEKYKTLPHLFSNDRQVRFFATNPEEYKFVSSYLEQEFTKRMAEDKSGDVVENESKKTTFSPFYLILTDNYIKIRKLGICEKIFGVDVDMGFGFIILEKLLSRLPSKCIDFITVDKTCGILRNDADNYIQISFKSELDELVDIKRCVESLSNIPIEFTDSLSYLPNSLTFLEMYKVGKIEQLNIMNRWKLNDPTTSLKVPIGINDQGELIILDLHEKYHGPHGLIAGTTGSGKSEFIITYILSMAINYSPNEVSFILIDYKGGGLAGAFENKKNNIRLPHLAGTITNLDKNELNRTLVSIDSELKRRQMVFNKVRDELGESTIDIYKYQKFFREGKITEPMPHLFIICDEFAELKQQQPDFMDNLISAARIGRSLGVHLILATQKPSGVVNDQIWSNTKFRVCLKVAEKGDSNEIIKCPDAAEIKNAGRFYLQVGYNEIFVLGQSGWSGASYDPSNMVKKEYDRSLSVIDNIGNVIKNISGDPIKKKVVASGDELSNILEYTTLLAQRESLSSPQLWLESIPPIIYLEDIINKYNYSSDKITAVIGEYDDPTNQYQNILTLTLNEEGNTMIYGVSGSYREMFLRTLIYSVSSRYSSELINFYILDFGSESMGIFSKLPHVGDVVLSTESEKIDKLFKMLEEEIFKRKKLFADYNGEYSIYCKNSGNKLPLITVIINNLESFKELYPIYEEMLLKLTREGRRCGIIFIITNGSQSGIYSRFLKNFNNEFVLDMNDRDGYADIFGRIGNVMPCDYPGRGLFKGENIYEFQTAQICDEDNIVEFIKEKSIEINQHNPIKAKPVPVLPETVTFDMVNINSFDMKAVPIGLIKETLSVCAYNFKATKATIISANELEACEDFLYSLLTQFKTLGNVVSIFMDYEGIFDKFKDICSSYCAGGFNSFIDKIIEFIDQKISGTNYELSIIITGVEKFKDNTDSMKIDLLTNKIKTLNNCHMIFVDSGYRLKKLAFEMWYTNMVVSSNGIWIGPGVAEQSAIKVSEYSKKYSVAIDTRFAWVFKNGSGTLIKLVGGDSRNEE